MTRPNNLPSKVVPPVESTMLPRVSDAFQFGLRPVRRRVENGAEGDLDVKDARSFVRVLAPLAHRHRLSVVVALLCVAVGSVFPIAAIAPVVEVDPLLENLESANVPVVLRFERQPLAKVLDELSWATGNLKVAGEGCGRRMLISVDYPQMPLKDALARLSAATGVAFEVQGPRKLRVTCPVPFNEAMTPPERIAKVEPLYPREEKVSQIGGRVVLQAAIGTDGQVANVRVLRGVLGHPAFEKSAVDAVKQWKYRPAFRNGKPVPIYFTVQVEFTLPAESR